MLNAIIAFFRCRTSIQLRIYLLSLVMLLLFLLASLASLWVHLNSVKLEKQQSIHFIVSDLITQSAAHSLRRGNNEALIPIVKAVVSSTEVSYLEVIDSSGLTFFSSHPELPAEHGNAQHLRTDIMWQSLSASFTDIEVDANSIHNKETKLGVIRFIIDHKALNSFVWSAVLNNLYALLLALIITIPMIFILGASLLRPLQHIMRDLKRFESGHYQDLHAIKRPYKDEYNTLSQALSRAGDAIDKSNSEVARKNQALVKQCELAMEAREIAHKANERKDIFVANITHELKGPLTGIISGVDLAESGLFDILASLEGLPQEAVLKSLKDDILSVVTSLDTAKYGSREIHDLINGLLNMIEDMHYDIQIKHEPICLMDALSDVVLSHKAEANHKGLAFLFEMPDQDDPLWVMADWSRVAQALNAIMSNAIHFTESGYICVAVALNHSGHDAIDLQVEVSDTGIGISDLEKSAIFDLLHIGQHPRNKVAPGVGMGLTIAHKVTTTLGGHLSLKSSQLNEGSTFVFQCPFKRIAPAVNSQSKKRAVHEIERGVMTPSLNVLYVDDSPMNQLIFQQYSQKHSVNLALADNGKLGYEKYIQGVYDALVLDCYMPVEDGFELVKKIRQYEQQQQSSRSLIFALTADHSEKNRQHCLSVGFDEFITKPYTRETYKDIVDKTLRYKLQKVETEKNVFSVE